MLLTIAEESLDPVEGIASNSIVLKLVQESHIKDLSKALEK